MNVLDPLYLQTYELYRNPIAGVCLRLSIALTDPAGLTEKTHACEYARRYNIPASMRKGVKSSASRFRTYPIEGLGAMKTTSQSNHVPWHSPGISNSE